MMKSQELLDRIEKLNVKIGKIEKRIAKHQKALNSQEEFEKHYGWLSTFEARKDYFKQEWEKNCNCEIRRANDDLKDALITLNKYQNALMLAQEKENTPVIKVFKDFFNNWKQEIKNYAEPMYQKYLDLSSEYCDLHNKYRVSRDEEIKTRLDNIHKLEREILSDSWVKVVYDCKHYSSKTFDEYLDNYMEDRYYELVNKTTNITGVITDVSMLYVGYDGTLNGVIIGENGKAKVETIIAGGYNENIIVNVKHGQCRHYRVLVKESR